MNTFVNKTEIRPALSSRSIWHSLSMIPSYIIVMLRPNFLVPIYHAVSDEVLPHIKYLYTVKEKEMFVNDIEYLTNHFTFVDLHTIIEAVKEGKELPDRSFHLTFDDGLREVYHNVYPVLKERGIGATLFLNPAFVGNRGLCFRHKASVILTGMENNRDGRAVAELLHRIAGKYNWHGSPDDFILSIPYKNSGIIDELAEILSIDFDRYLIEQRPYLEPVHVKEMMDNGITIGAHSIDHPLYNELTLEEQIQQTAVSIREISKMFDIDYTVFAFPFNDRGISASFYENAADVIDVDVFFGTSAFKKDTIKNSIQRLMLDSDKSCETIIYNKCKERLYNLLKGNNKIRR